MNPRNKHDAPEFSRPLAAERIPAQGQKEDIEADATERQKLAARFALLELKSLRATLNIQIVPISRTIAVTGKMMADVTQSCVVTLEPLPNHIEQDISAFYAFSKSPTGTTGLEPFEEGEEDMEVIANGEIDLGELVAQHLGVALDPWPRKEGAILKQAASEPETTANPFASLLKNKKKPKNKGG